MNKFPVVKVWAHGNRTGYLLKADLAAVTEGAKAEFTKINPAWNLDVSTNTSGFREYSSVDPDIWFTDDIDAVDDQAPPEPSNPNIPRPGHTRPGYCIVLGESPKPSLFDRAMDWLRGIFGGK